MRIMHYNHRARSDYRISWRDCQAKPLMFIMYSPIFFKFFIFFMKIILKQLFTSALVNIA